MARQLASPPAAAPAAPATAARRAASKGPQVCFHLQAERDHVHETKRVGKACHSGLHSYAMGRLFLCCTGIACSHPPRQAPGTDMPGQVREGCPSPPPRPPPHPTPPPTTHPHTPTPTRPPAPPASPCPSSSSRCSPRCTTSVPAPGDAGKAGEAGSAAVPFADRQPEFLFVGTHGGGCTGSRSASQLCSTAAPQRRQGGSGELASVGKLRANRHESALHLHLTPQCAAPQAGATCWGVYSA